MLWEGRQRSCRGPHFVLAFLTELPCCKDHVYRNVPLSFLNPQRPSLIEMFIQAIRQDFLPDSSQQLIIKKCPITPYGCHRLENFLSICIGGLWMHLEHAFLHMMWSNYVSFSAGPLALYISAVIASDPGALSDGSCLIAFVALYLWQCVCLYVLLHPLSRILSRCTLYTPVLQEESLHVIM